MSESTPDQPNTTDTTPMVADRLTDFSDRLSPMLVKELRQGLKARTFVIMFLMLQALLMLVLMFAALTGSTSEAGEDISQILIMFFSLTVLVIQPVRAIGSLHREVHHSTIELLVLTRLNAWKIVLGKWLSLVSQSALILAAIVPYIILRYWFGNMNLAGELSLVLLIFLTSTVITAIIVGISGIPSVILRGLLPLLAAIYGIIIIPALCFDGGGRELQALIDIAAVRTSESFWTIFGVILGGAYISWICLGIGASMIAPVAENHSTVRRLLAMAILIIMLPIIAFSSISLDAAVTICLVVAIPVIIFALTDNFDLLPTHVSPFVKRGALGKLAGRFLYPGWPSGVFAALIIIALSAIAMILCLPNGLTENDVLTLVSLLGSILLPAIILNYFMRRVRQRLTSYVLILCACFVVVMTLGFIADSIAMDTSKSFLWAFSWIPAVGMILSHYDQDKESLYLFTNSLIAGVYALLLILPSLKQFPTITEVENRCINPE